MSRKHAREPVRPYCQPCPTCPRTYENEWHVALGQTRTLQSALNAKQAELNQTAAQLQETQATLNASRDCFKEIDPQKQLQCLKLQLVYK